jgi:hypothetical protein
VVHVVNAMQMPPVLHALALGAMALSYHQVVLVFTDRRVIEVLLGVRGKKAETRVRSFPWKSVKDFRLRLRKLSIVPVQGKKQAWRVPLRGDRRLLGLLVPRVRPLLMPEGAATAQPLPLLHCPGCGSSLGSGALSCGSCRATFRSPRLAAWLSVAFPGAGLLYAGHPFLAAADFVGEVLLYLVFLLLMLEAEPGTALLVGVVGAVFFLMTKLESVHLSRILSARSKPDPEPRRARYRRFGLVGALASLMVVGGAFPLLGSARPVIDRDLDVAGQEDLWEGSRDRAQWVAFDDDPTARSQWMHPSGLAVTVFAYPQGLLDSTSEFRNSLRTDFLQRGATILREDDDVPAPHHGFRFVVTEPTEEGRTLSMANYFILDEANRDIHQVLAAAIEDDGSEAEEVARDLLSKATWVAAQEPSPLPREP